MLISASGAYGSTIASSFVAFEDKTYSSISAVPITKSGSSSEVRIDLSVTDTRGRTATSGVGINVLPYSKPTISTFRVDRALSTGVADDSGTYAKVTMKFNISPVNNLNSKAWKVDYRATGGTWATFSNGNVYAYDNSFTSAAPILGADNTYEIRLTLTDSFSHATYNKDVGSTFDIINVNTSGKGIAFGGVSTKDAMQVFMPAEFTGGLKSGGKTVLTSDQYTTVSGYAAGNGTGSVVTIKIPVPSGHSPIGVGKSWQMSFAGIIYYILEGGTETEFRITKADNSPIGTSQSINVVCVYRKL